jgi:2-amino-4-hydroxy-6-hydroxymethyldihydropteridine diphosphokinase
MHTACLGIGSNLNAQVNVEAAVVALREALDVVAVSTVWESPAEGCEAPDYANAAVVIETELSIAELTIVLKRIESDLGRVRGPLPSRIVPIDIDLLVFDGHVQRDSLWSYAYCAVPAAELLPDLCNPTTGEPLSAVSRRLAGKVRITPLADIFRSIARPLAPTDMPKQKRI